MALFLVQHGKCFSKEQDPEQGLSPDGMADTWRIAEVAKEYGVEVNRILHSSKKRARQTAEIFAEFLNPAEGIAEAEGLRPLDDPTVFAEILRPGDDLMLVGHLPFLERLTAFLITGDTDITVFRFQNGGIVCLDEYPGSDSWTVKWALMPEIK